MLDRCECLTRGGHARVPRPDTSRVERASRRAQCQGLCAIGGAACGPAGCLRNPIAIPL
jgi:hypothetical protein